MIKKISTAVKATLSIVLSTLFLSACGGTGGLAATYNKTEAREEEPRSSSAKTLAKSAGWAEQAAGRVYYGPDGKRHTGWLTLDSARYWFDDKGIMATGFAVIDGSTKVFTNDGRLLSGTPKDWNLRLVGPNTPLPKNYSCETVTLQGKPFDARGAEALQSLFADAKAAGTALYLVSGYRTIDYQKDLYARSVQGRIDQGMTPEAAEAETALYVAKPGYSEHNLGLACDIVSSTWYTANTGLESWFDETPEFAWLSENAWKYGFILRYPKDKVELTGIGYEPWHYRYVGVDAAKIIRDDKICLEEYWGKYLS